MSKSCPRCGYQPSFWKNKPWGYYCPICAADLKPGKALFKPWKRRLYILSALFRIAMVASWFMFARLMLQLQNIHNTIPSSPDRAQSILHANQVTQLVHYCSIAFFWILILLLLSAVLQAVAALPFGIAHLRLHSYRRLLNPAARWPRTSILAIVILSGVILLITAIEVFNGPSGDFIAYFSASPFFLAALTLLVLWSTLRNLRASHQPLYPLQWNEAESRFVELKPQAVSRNPES